jgi:GxxExxY protein
MAELLYKEEVYAIVGAAMEVYNELGPGFLEAVYQEALGMEMSHRSIPFLPLQELVIYYKGQPLKKTYEADFVAYGKIIIEIKALDVLTTREEAQLLNYQKATGYQLGLLINFGDSDRLIWKRMILTDSHSRSLAKISGSK